MAEVVRIQVQAHMQFEDGFVVTISTPAWVKDIRQGCIFKIEELEDILRGSGEGFAELVAIRTPENIHAMAKSAQAPSYYPKPSKNGFKKPTEPPQEPPLAPN